jgi:hypothetical protein
VREKKKNLPPNSGRYNWAGNRERGKRRSSRGCLPERRKEESTSSSVDSCRRGRSPERRITERELIAREKRSLAPGSGWRLFLKHIMGAPDSLQCLSGAHRTAHSSCPVNHLTTHRRKGSARGGDWCIGQCTVQCPVHTGLSGEPRQREFEISQIFYLIFNQTKSQLIITQNNTCWDRYCHPHIFSHNFQNILP